MAAAPDDDFDAAEPILDCLRRQGVPRRRRRGQGSTVKTINQLLCGVHIAAAAEAMALAEKAGLDTRLVLQILGNSAAGIVDAQQPRPAHAGGRAGSDQRSRHLRQGHVAGAGCRRAEKVALPLSAAAHQMFLAASGAGHGAADDSQVIRAYRALNGTKH
jgi:putative dehydrogenase